MLTLREIAANERLIKWYEESFNKLLELENNYPINLARMAQMMERKVKEMIVKGEI